MRDIKCGSVDIIIYPIPMLYAMHHPYIEILFAAFILPIMTLDIPQPTI
jgi:hypothetical protein